MIISKISNDFGIKRQNKVWHAVKQTNQPSLSLFTKLSSVKLNDKLTDQINRGKSSCDCG